MHICIFSIIIIIILIIFISHEKIEEFKVSTNDITQGSSKDIGERYRYPGCIGCITTDRMLKPKFMYDISDNRCIKNNDQYNNTNDLDSLITYDKLPSYDYISCETNLNSMYSSIRGRYIIIFRKDSIKMRINNISVHERDTTKPPFNATIFSTNIEKNPDGTFVYPDSVLNAMESNTLTFESGSNSSRIIISLDKNYDIGYIRIKHSNTSDAETLNGAVIAIATIADTDTTSESASIVFYTILNTIDTDRIIYTYNHLDALQSGIDQSFPIVNTWEMPCDTCTNSSGTLFKGHYYKNGIRCFKPLLDTINKTIFNQDIQPSDIVNFNSCSSVFDTRYVPSRGAIIQILRGDSNDTGFRLSRIQIYSDYSNNKYDLTVNSSLSALATTYLNSTSLFDNLTDGTESTMLETTSSRNSKIHINLGSNYNISGIGLSVLKTEQTNLVGLKIYIISVDESNPFDSSLMRVTSVKTITANDVSTNFIESGDLNNYTYLLALNYHINDPIVQYTDLVINNEVVYDPSNRYLSTYKHDQIYYQIPYTIYRTINTRRVMAKSKIDSSVILDKIAASDAVTLFNISSSSTDVVPVSNTSHILSPISGRYIQIVPTTSQTLENTIQTITVYNSLKNVIKTVTPNVVYKIPESTYTNYLSNVNTGATEAGTIIIDLGQNTAITFIKLDILDTTKLTNATVNLVNDSGTKVFTYTLSSPQSTTYIITDNSPITVAGPHFINKYAYPACINLNLCNAVAPNTYYILNDTRCFKSNATIGTTCDNTCIANIQTFNKANRSTYPAIDSNFGTCGAAGTDTRFLPGPTLDDLSAGALASLFGCYSLKLRLSSYTGPVVNIRRSTDNVIKDFYANRFGVLNDRYDMTGMSLATWLGTAIGYVIIWYDQSGKANDASNTTGGNLMNIIADASGNYYLTGASGSGLNLGYNKTPSIFSYFAGNVTSTVVMKLGTVRNKPTANSERVLIYGGSGSSTSLIYGYYVYSGVTYLHTNDPGGIKFIGNINIGSLDNCTLTYRYDGAKTYSYLNSGYIFAVGSSRNIIAGGNLVINNKVTLGGTTNSPNADFYNVYLFNSNLTDADRLIAEKF